MKTRAKKIILKAVFALLFASFLITACETPDIDFEHELKDKLLIDKDSIKESDI